MCCNYQDILLDLLKTCLTACVAALFEHHMQLCYGVNSIRTDRYDGYENKTQAVNKWVSLSVSNVLVANFSVIQYMCIHIYIYRYVYVYIWLCIVNIQVAACSVVVGAFLPLLNYTWVLGVSVPCTSPSLQLKARQNWSRRPTWNIDWFKRFGAPMWKMHGMDKRWGKLAYENKALRPF